MQDCAGKRAGDSGLLIDEKGWTAGMKPIPDCVPDALSMIITTARAVSDEEFIHSKVLLKVMGGLADYGEFGSHPSDVYLQCWEIACRALGVKDPYDNEKARGDKTGLGVLQNVEERMRELGCGKLRGAIKAAFVGSMLDYAASLGREEMSEKVDACFGVKPAVDDSAALEEAVSRAESVMIVTNRAGEIALDKPLCDALLEMGKTVYLAVAAKPVFVMATERDAENVAMSSGIQVVSPGTAMYGLMPDRASSEFRALLAEVGVVIAKGCTHFSTMARSREMFFILRAEQEEVAKKLHINVSDGAIVRVPVAK